MLFYHSHVLLYLSECVCALGGGCAWACVLLRIKSSASHMLSKCSIYVIYPYTSSYCFSIISENILFLSKNSVRKIRVQIFGIYFRWGKLNQMDEYDAKSKYFRISLVRSWGLEKIFFLINSL